jgi:hypothetical protein
MSAHPGEQPDGGRPEGILAQRALLEALRTGGGDASPFLDLLARGNLTGEQHAVVDLLLALRDEGEAQEESPRRTTRSPGNRALAAHQAPAERELADLREVNDTVAAALGACPVCWGGDDACAVCRGRGKAGGAAPDPDLFRELVVPAVRRVRALRRANGHTDSSRAGADCPQSWR